MPLDHAPQSQNTRAVWIWDLEVRRIRAANPAALRLWEATSQNELATRAFSPSDPMTRAAAEADEALIAENAQIKIHADVAGHTRLELRVDRPIAHLLRFAAVAPVAQQEELVEPPPPSEDGNYLAFDASPVAMSILDAKGVVLRDNPAAEALFGRRPAASWAERHLTYSSALRAMANARSRGGDGYIGAIASPSRQDRRMSVSLARLDERLGASSPLLATCLPIPEEETAMLRGNAAEVVLQSAPDAIAVFSLETGALQFSNRRAVALSPDFRTSGVFGATLETLFPSSAERIRGALTQVMLDVRQTPKQMQIPHPSGDGRMLSVRVSMSLWRGDAALWLWIDPSSVEAKPAPPSPAASQEQPAPRALAPAVPTGGKPPLKPKLAPPVAAPPRPRRSRQPLGPPPEGPPQSLGDFLDELAEFARRTRNAEDG